MRTSRTRPYLPNLRSTSRSVLMKLRPATNRCVPSSGGVGRRPRGRPSYGDRRRSLSRERERDRLSRERDLWRSRDLDLRSRDLDRLRTGERLRRRTGEGLRRRTGEGLRRRTGEGLRRRTGEGLRRLERDLDRDLDRERDRLIFRTSLEGDRLRERRGDRSLGEGSRGEGERALAGERSPVLSAGLAAVCSSSSPRSSLSAPFIPLASGDPELIVL